MKLPEHVNHLRSLITASFDKQFSRLGIGSGKQIDIDKLPTDLHAERLRFEEMLQNHIGETGSYQEARIKLIDELTFTLFNRIAAVKVMESASIIPPVIIRQPEHGDRSFGHKAWLEIHPEMRNEEREGLHEYIQHAFDELGETLSLYSRDYPYSLLPDAISLNEIIDAFNAVEKDPQVSADIWQSDDVLGWLYESYNNAKKDAFKESGEKVEYDKVYLQSQVYTPRWVVQFLIDNSLGKLYLEMYPDSKVRKNIKIANAPDKVECETKPLHHIRLIDPACGSGNFLLYAFDLFYVLYLDQIENYGAEYLEADIPRWIIENNLHGIDLDSRAIQLAQLGLYIKARKKQRKMGSLTFKVVSSDFYLPEYATVKHIFEDGGSLDANQKALIADIWGDLQYAYKFGSLILLNEKLKSRLYGFLSQKGKQERLFSDQQLGFQPTPTQLEIFLENDIAQEQEFIRRFFGSLKNAVAQYSQAQGNSFLTSQAKDAVTYLELLNQHFDVAAANPPYTNSGDFGPELKFFIEANYNKPYKFHTNLYATFIKRCYDFVSQHGYIAMVHPPTFMYIKTFEDVRKFIIEKTHIDLFIEWGYLGMFNPSARVDSAVYILNKTPKNNVDSVFIKLNNLYETKRYDALFEAFDQYLAGGRHELLNTIPQSKLKIIQSWPFIYWISDEFRSKFGENNLESLTNVKTGISTGSNERFSRYWWEVNINDISSNYVEDKKKWVYFLKGGPYKKWYGNIFLVLNWFNNGQEIKNYPKSTVRNENYYFIEGISTVKATSKGGDFRYSPKNTIFSDGAPSIFFDKSLKSVWFGLAVLNSPIVKYAMKCLNPTVNTQVGDLQRIPFINPSAKIQLEIEQLSKTNMEISKKDSSYCIYEPNFQLSPLSDSKQKTFPGSIKEYINQKIHLDTHVLINEAKTCNILFSIYDMTEYDKKVILTEEGNCVGSLSVDVSARNAYLSSENIEFPLDQICTFIETLPVKTFSAAERATIESEFTSLYQYNNDLEEFCIRHQVNPINVWYWFNQSKVIPEQRMYTLAMEFLADLIREILTEDEDGIVPLATGLGEKALLERIEDKFRQKGFSPSQFSMFDSVLGRPLNEYINQYFFAALSDHLNLFMYLPKTPFIWHLSSGPEQGFDCYIIIYKWSRDKLMRIRAQYIERRERSLINQQSDLVGNESAEAQNKKDKIFKQLQEIESFKEKIGELLSEGYDPILDDGVGKNIAPLQKKGMIPYEVLNPGQLEKYLHADW